MIHNKVELLSPAANLEFGRAAIMAGADAVYIGGPGFGARRAAGNSVEDIETLVRFAHGFGARVYVAMNTLLFEDELESARAQAIRMHEIGVDALIVQDMAFLKMDLPPLALHASTQTFNLTPERVKLLADAGFSRVILERGASLEQIKAIRQTTDVELEVFVHGAICVSHSGQCYFGHAVCGRGGNRGACAQACRAQYNLENGRGDRLLSHAHLLSPKDMDLSDRLPELLELGICSLKIEGRLKELSYVINNTVHYNSMLEDMMVERTSSGTVVADFESDPRKSFSRGATHYLLDGPKGGLCSGATTKSIGQRIGTVVTLGRDYAVVTGAAGVLGSGDGVCFTDDRGRQCGTNINAVDNERVYFNNMDGVEKGITIFRNHDHRFNPTERSVRRTIGIYIKLRTTQDGRLIVAANDLEGNSAEISMRNTFDIASNTELATSNIMQALGRSGGTVFEVQGTDTDFWNSEPPFIRAAQMNALRRELLHKLLETRIVAHKKNSVGLKNLKTNSYQGFTLDFRANIANSLARSFYEELGFKVQEMAVELLEGDALRGREVMRTPYCIRREVGACIRGRHFDGEPSLPQIKIAASEKLFVENNGLKFELHFDCDKCQMALILV